MSSIQVTIRCPATGTEETVGSSVGGDLTFLVAGLEKVREETNAVLTKHVEQSRKEKSSAAGDQQDLENNYLEQDQDDEEDEGEELPNKKAKPDQLA